MAVPLPVHALSPAEYLLIEREADYKSEYLGGEMFAMAGATALHNLISANVLCELCIGLKGKVCAPYAGDLRIHTPSTGLYTYPDVSVICGPPEFTPADDRLETVTNPTLLVEVLSDSTEAYDRGMKFEHYRSLPSLAEYVLISQKSALVEVFLRQPDGTWRLTPVNGLGASAPLASLGLELRLAEVYDRVEFPASVPLRSSTPATGGTGEK